MPASNSNQTVGEMVTANPALAVVFERFGIDYCCGGKQPLAAACQAIGVDSAAVQAALDQATATPVAQTEDWTQAALETLVLNILNTHHEYLRQELPRLGPLVHKIVQVHGHLHAELAEVEYVFTTLTSELMAHMVKEEQILFPAIVRLERDHRAPAAHPWLINPIRVMEDEHAAVGVMLATLKRLTAGYAAPENACNTYRVVYASLAKLEADLHVHIHKENNILFPRAHALEQEMAVATSR